MRTCVKCHTEKDSKAFIGFREVCRICWYDLSKEEKKKRIAKSNRLSVYMSNKKAWEKEKLLLKSGLNFEVL